MKLKYKRSKLLAEYCQEGNVLDVGFTDLPNKYLKNPIGIDIVLPKERPENYKDTVQCNLNKENIPFADEFFDNIVAGDVIEHLENPPHFLREANRVLKNSGRLIICTPQANDWWTTLHNWFFRKWVRDPDLGGHLQNWTFLDMIRILKKNGFEIKKIEGFYTNFPKINLHIRVRRFPQLSWQVFYIAEKIKKPDSTVLARVDKELVKIKQ